jgi:hypothetical protein
MLYNILDFLRNLHDPYKEGFIDLWKKIVY